MKRTHVLIDEHLVARASELTGLRALRELVAREEQRQVARRLRGSGWEGDLGEMRRS